MLALVLSYITAMTAATIGTIVHFGRKILSQVDDLTTALSGASTGLATLGTDITALEAALVAHPAAADLTAEIAAANAISTGVASIDASVKAALAPPAAATTAPTA